ncbi:MAG: hypothetical protein ISR57_02185 [Bacteroidales bacterium]|nr:hypothetical protein [Bacteroidales bacterium]
MQRPSTAAIHCGSGKRMEKNHTIHCGSGKRMEKNHTIHCGSGKRMEKNQCHSWQLKELEKE